MAVDKARVHVTFHPSGAGSLKLALKTLGRDEEVLALADDLSFGPINPGDVRQRMQWGIDELGSYEDAESEEAIAQFWKRVTLVRTEIVAWMSRRYVSEYCGLLELLWRVKDVPVSVIDVADVAFTSRDGSPDPGTSLAFSWVHDRQIVAHDLLSRAKRVSDIERKRYEAEWRRLREENAALRMLSDSGVVSIPLTHYDDLILSFVTNEWQKCARVVACTLAKQGEGPYRQCSSDVLIFDRLLELIDHEIEGKNEHELWSMGDSWVRRRPPTVAR